MTVIADLYLTLCRHLVAKSWTVAYQAPLSMGIFQAKNTGKGCHSLLHGIFTTYGSNQCLLHWQVDSLPLSHQGNHWALTIFEVFFKQ